MQIGPGRVRRVAPGPSGEIADTLDTVVVDVDELGATLLSGLRTRIVRGSVFALTLVGAVALGSFVTEHIMHKDRGLAGSEQPLEIKDLITRVREELASHEIEMREHQELALFRLKDFEMEINYLVRTGSTVKTEVVGVGTDLSVDRERVQKLVLRWEACPQHLRGSVGASTSPPPLTTATVKHPIVVGPVPAIAMPAFSSVESHTGVPDHDDCN